MSQSSLRASGVVTGHPVLNSNSIEMARALAEARLLAEFHTTIDTTAMARLAPTEALREVLSRRSLPTSVHRRTTSHPLPELSRLLRRRFPALARPGRFPADGVLHTIDRAISRRIAPTNRAVYAYEDAALASFERASALGVPRLYDLPIAYWRLGEKILDEEAEREPEWAGTLARSGVGDHAARMERKDQELSLATEVVVASQFTAKSLAEFPGSSPLVTVIPYGAPDPVGEARAIRHSDGVLRVLFVGGLSQRKGLSYLFDAVDRFGRAAHLTVVGRKLGSSTKLDHALRAENVSWLPYASHSRVLRLMDEHDVLVFPSLFEGFGLVITEALSRGLPVIATPHTAAPDLITEGKDGWIVPVRSSESIALHLEALRNDETRRHAMSEAALGTARTAVWSSYRESIVRLVDRYAR